MYLGLTIARPQWAPRRWMLVALLVEPTLITLAGVTNPWHLLGYRGARAHSLTRPGVELAHGIADISRARLSLSDASLIPHAGSFVDCPHR